MAFNTSSKHAFLVTALTSGSWNLCEGVPERTESGPDALALTYEGRFDTTLDGDSPSLSIFDRGDDPPYYAGGGTWRITSARPTRLYGPFWKCEVSAKGLISAQEPKVRWITGSEAFTAENVTIPIRGLVNKAQGRQPTVGCEISYLSTSGTPSTPAVAVAATPASPRPPNPTNWWTWVTDENAVYRSPYGWVREAVDADRIAPNLWWITERYNYIFEITG